MYGEFDIVVVGGGPAGIMAATSAAPLRRRSGKPAHAADIRGGAQRARVF